MPERELKDEFDMGNATAEKRTRLENLFTEGLKNLGIHPRDILVEGPTVRIEGEGREFRVPTKSLSSGISVLLQEAGKRKRMPDWPFSRQIRYLVKNGKRMNLQRKEKRQE